MSDPIFNVIDVTDDTMMVDTTGLYRVILHNSDTEEEVYAELLSAKDAVFIASCHNNIRSLRGTCWAEVISYRDWQERERWNAEREDREEWLERRLKEIADSQPPSPVNRVRRFLARTAALIW